MILHLKNRFWSLGGSSSVVDDEKRPVYNVKGKIFSIRRRKYVCTLDGEKLYEVRNKFWHWFYPTAFIFNSEHEKIATVKRKIVSLRTEFFVEGNEHEYLIEGNWIGWNLSVKKDGEEIGKINRNFTIINDAFTLEASEENMPFLIALVIAIDNMQDKASKRNN